MADDNKNPLDVLEELLNDTPGGAKGGGSGGDSAKPKEKTEEELAVELEQKRKEYEQKHKEQKVVDDQKLVEQREAIVGIKDTKEYQARVQQDAEKKSEDEQKAVASDGFEISQLDHTKV